MNADELAIAQSLHDEDAYFRANQDKANGPEHCFEEGHVFGCPGAAGGDHLVPDDWFEDEEGYLRAPLSYENREGLPEFNGAFNRW